jgi:hypothetical protein
MWRTQLEAIALLFVPGGYLAMAGQRSNLYQPSNELPAYLAGQMRAGSEQP